MRKTLIVPLSVTLFACAPKRDPDRDVAPSEAELERKACREDRMKQHEECSHLMGVCMESQTEFARQANLIGSTVTVGIGTQVVLERGGRDRVRRFSRGHDCRIDPGGRLKVIGARLVGDELGEWPEYLVRFTRPPEASEHYIAPEQDAKPFLCPEGAIFYLEDPLFYAEE